MKKRKVLNNLSFVSPTYLPHFIIYNFSIPYFAFSEKSLRNAAYNTLKCIVIHGHIRKFLSGFFATTFHFASISKVKFRHTWFLLERTRHYVRRFMVSCCFELELKMKIENAKISKATGVDGLYNLQFALSKVYNFLLPCAYSFIMQTTNDVSTNKTLCPAWKAEQQYVLTWVHWIKL